MENNFVNNVSNEFISIDLFVYKKKKNRNKKLLDEKI